jgi:hypothetical protein
VDHHRPGSGGHGKDQNLVAFHLLDPARRLGRGEPPGWNGKEIFPEMMPFTRKFGMCWAPGKYDPTAFVLLSIRITD